MRELIAILFATLLAIALIAITAYVHYRLPVHMRHSRATTRMVQVLLISVGALGAYLGALWTDGESSLLRVAAMVCGFGVAHVPAFFVLYIKRLRGEYGSG